MVKIVLLGITILLFALIFGLVALSNATHIQDWEDKKG